MKKLINGRLVECGSDTPKTITDADVRRLRAEAAEHGDDAQVHICSVALGEEKPITTAARFESRYGGGGYSAAERTAIMRIKSQKQAWAACARALGGGGGGGAAKKTPRPSYGTLRDYRTGEEIRKATKAEREESDAAMPTGAFRLGNRTVYVEP